MKKPGYVIMGLILLVAFLWATTGVTVYTHYCSLSDSVNTSIFLEDADCGHHNKQAVTQSCCAEKNACESNSAETDCCATQKQFFKLAASFNIPDDSQKVKIIDIRLFFNLDLLWIQEAEVIEKEHIQLTDKLPPGSYGKELLLALHQQKIAPAPIV
jgi:hypothetical protein